MKSAAQLVGLILLGLGLWAGAATAVSERVTSGDRAEAQGVVVRDLTVNDLTVTGVVVNRTQHLIRDVRLLVRHTWLWENERHPGTANPGRSEYYKLNGEIPPGGSVSFRYELPAPLPVRADGFFVHSAEVATFTEIG